MTAGTTPVNSETRPETTHLEACPPEPGDAAARVGFGAGQAWVLHCYRCGAEASTTSGKDWHKL